MKEFKLNSKNAGVANAASKACAWILSIMLVVTGMAPSFAANNEAAKAGNEVTAVKKVEKNDKKTSKKESKKSPKITKEKEEKNGKKNKTSNKRAQTFSLNATGDVYAEFDGSSKKLSVSKKSSGDMNIDREKWIAMATALGANYSNGYSYWASSQVEDIEFKSDGIFLPKDCTNFFAQVKGEIKGCEKLNTSKVNTMVYMFSNAKKAKPDVSKWDVSKVTSMERMFIGASLANPDVSKWNVGSLENAKDLFNTSGIKKADLSKWALKSDFFSNEANSYAMFQGCSKLEYMKTPAGLKTSVTGANSTFKIVKLKRGNPAVVEKDNQSLYNVYTINESGDRGNVYHIFLKSKYTGVTFDKNGGNTEAWVNHEIVERNKTIAESGGSLPAENPTGTSEFLGWSKNPNATAPDFDANTKVRR